MSAIKGRTRRLGNVCTVILQTRILPEAKSALDNAAEKSGISLALYIEALVQQIVADQSSLPTFAHLARPR